MIAADLRKVLKSDYGNYNQISLLAPQWRAHTSPRRTNWNGARVASILCLTSTVGGNLTDILKTISFVLLHEPISTRISIPTSLRRTASHWREFPLRRCENNPLGPGYSTNQISSRASLIYAGRTFVWVRISFPKGISSCCTWGFRCYKDSLDNKNTNNIFHLTGTLTLASPTQQIFGISFILVYTSPTSDFLPRPGNSEF
jgi:hypothetical protein